MPLSFPHYPTSAQAGGRTPRWACWGLLEGDIADPPAGGGRPARTRGSALHLRRNPTVAKTKWHCVLACPVDPRFPPPSRPKRNPPANRPIWGTIAPQSVAL